MTPDTLLRWQRRLIAEKYDGSLNDIDGGHGKPSSLKPVGYSAANRRAPEAVPQGLPGAIELAEDIVNRIPFTK